MPLLEIRNLQLDFLDGDARLRAVDGVSLSVEAGETVCLVGESGCGKSVTALSIARLAPTPPAHYAAGEILLDGRDVLKMSNAELRAIRGGVVGYVFQEPGASLNPVMRVGAQIKESLRLHRPLQPTFPMKRVAADVSPLHLNSGKSMSRLTSAATVQGFIARTLVGRILSSSDGERVAEGRVRGSYDAEVIRLLKLVGIPAPESRVKDYPFQLSGGMQQRVMIAMALASQPKLLVADEPTTALDVTIQAQILDLLRELKQSLGMAMLLITHNLGIVGDVADRVAVMYAGQILELAPARELLRRPLHPYTRALMASVPKLRWGEAADEPALARQSGATTAREDARPTKRLQAIPGNVPRIGNFPPGCRFAPRCPIAKSECSNAMPELLEVEPDRWVRCPFWK